MSERKETAWAIVLSFRQHNVEIESAKKYLKSMLNSLRCKASKED